MSHARVPTIDPDGQREGDAGAIPLSSLRPPHAPARQPSEESFGGPPPAHYAHPHGFDNPNYFEGYDVGNQPREEDLAPSASASGSGSSASRQNEKQGWGKFDTYVGGREHAHQHPYNEGHGHTEKSHFQGAALQEDGLPHHGAGGHNDESSDDETDDFNWSSDEDDPDTVVEADGTKRIRAKRGRRIYMFLMNLARPIRIMILGLLGSAIALVPFIVVLTAFPRNAARPQVEVWSIWVAIIWAAACGTFLVLNWVPTLLEKIATAIWGKVPASFAKYVEVVKATLIWAKLMLCIAWAWISLGGIIGIEFGGQNDQVRPSYFHYVFLTLQALFGSSVIIYVEKLCLRLIATNFHKTAVADRLETNQKAVKALDKLHESEYVKGSRDQSRRATGNWASKFGFGSRPASPGPNTPGHRPTKSSGGPGGYFGTAATQPASSGSGTKTPLQRTHRKDGSGNKTPTFDVQAGTGLHSGRRPNFASQLSEALTTAAGKKSRLFQGRKARSQQSARKLARKLFYNLGHHRDSLVAEDFYPYFKTTEEAREAFGFFDADNNGDISKAEMRDAVQRIYREKRALAVSLRDMGSAVSKLDGVLMFLGLIIMVFIWLLIFNRDSTVANIVPLSTFVVGFSFVFGNSAKTIFESMIFIFATHPYDVGDLVCVDENWMFVESFGMLSTTFRTVTNQYIVAPNAMLASQKYIFNSRRSGATWEVTFIQVGFDTLIQLIDEFRAKMRQFVKENDREWGGGLEVNYDQISNQNSVQLVIAMEHKGNWQDWGARWARRTKLMRHVKTVCEELGIVYSLPPQPVTFHPRSGRAPFQPTMSAKTSFMSPRAARMPGSSAAGAEGGGGQGGGSFIPVGFTQPKKKEDESS
ncbi:hypothetical protein IE81DRAFT_323312 [Ceraceosorus guamensis]|uniref:EF-hand domain-containing protein n=1 Tax=Ceraceosorus guamensis TaxID=1522189 RepID=A0A316W4M1_9BASI|nr:hypothetical protein IE81DRAFT_323312 [Ceraceosorus guamensis]PWN42555.1 hypothetical protein IE81DRAFT_323312 [Ceraceosorus guamensis]